MNYTKFNNQFLPKMIVGIGAILLLGTVNSFGQDCPSFRVVSVNHTDQNHDKGSVEIEITSSKIYSQDNFQVRQRDIGVSGELGYDVDLTVTRNTLMIDGLKKSEDMFLKEYVVLFYDKTCQGGQLVEVGTFKIK